MPTNWPDRLKVIGLLSYLVPWPSALSLLLSRVHALLSGHDTAYKDLAPNARGPIAS